MSKQMNYVWYASFGSNLFQDRFRCYIEGGQPPGSNRREVGSRDCTLPIKNSPVSLPYKLYFSGWSDRWDGAGAFIDTVKDEQAETWGRMYLITDEQFEDVVRQENGVEDMTVDIEEVKKKGSLIIDGGSYYGNLLYAGDEEGYPIFTFTNPKPLSEMTITRPSTPYLAMLIRGFMEAYTQDVERITNYLYEKPGVPEHYSRKEIHKFVQEVAEQV